MRAWLASHLRVLVTATSSTLVVALVAVAAIVSSGYTAQRLNLDAASVWVVDDARHFVGRANTQVFELDTVVASPGESTRVVQDGSTVLLVDEAAATVSILDPATAQLRDTVALPADRPRVLTAQGTVVVYSEGTGELWTMPAASLAAFDTASSPTLNLGAGTIVSLDAAGTLVGFSAETQQVFEVEVSDAATVRSTSTTHFETTVDDFAVTSVAGRWAVLDLDSGVMETPSGRVGLAALLAGGEPALQEPAVGGDAVLVGVAGGLVRVPFAGEPTRALSGRTGSPAAPVTLGGCTFAAWSGGSAWRSCDGTSTDLELAQMPAGGALEFQRSGESLVLNDTTGGGVWAVQADGRLIDNWERLIADMDQDTVEREDEQTPPETEQQQVPPVAVDDELGARPGRASRLPVLINDFDANGDVIVVTGVDAIDPAAGRVDVIEEGRALQLSLEPSAAGVLRFGYTIGDGRGGVASASVTVTVRSASENSAPRQLRRASLDVVSGGQLTTQVLGDWVDPDGDPVYLAGASVAAPDRVSHRADGALFFTDSGQGVGEAKSVTVTVSDGTDSASGTLSVTSHPSGAAPLVAEPFGVLAYAGVERRIDPLEHVRGGNGSVRLAAVPGKTGVTITANLQTGVFRFLAESPGTVYLDYTVTDDVQTVTGRVRVDVAAPPDTNTTPITVPQTVFVPSQRSETVDVASRDIDPAGGVLVVTGVTGVTAGAPLRAEVLEQRDVRVSLLGPLAGPVTVTYRVSNGLAEAEGTITVVEIPRPALLQPPIARDDTVTVRVGDAVTIDVLANDEHPDGEAMSLDPVLVDDVGDDAGLLFASGQVLRYLAPDRAATVQATYQVSGPGGQVAQARVTIQVREPDPDTNKAPAPSRITARVLAGERVRVDVPLAGVDPDGDSVQLLGVATNPDKGAVVEVGTDHLVYEAGEYSTGTDTFTYTLVDALGARATGVVRVGISPRLDGARNPVAIEDEVTARPGATVSARVLANDSDPDGGALHVVSVESQSDAVVAEIVDGELVRLEAPAAEGEYGLLYTVANERGGTATNFLTLVVDADTPPARPVVTDTVLTLADILDVSTVDVDVLARAFLADGPVRSLGVSLVPGFGGAQVLADKSVRVTVGDAAQTIPFALVHPDDDTVRSYAFIWVPGYDDALPQVDRRAPALIVESEASLTIELDEHVLAVGGRSVRLTDSSTVTATHSNGDSLVVDEDTLRFTSSDLYYGPASISFEVTDGASASDPDGRTANLVLPITVIPRDNQPPVFNGALLEFEPGQERTIDLTALTTYRYPDDLDELVYDTVGAAPDGFRFQVDGQRLVLRAEEDAVKYSTTSLTLGVRDAVNEGRSGTIQLTVVPSTRPLARPAPDAAVVRRGETTTIDVLANDGATNPFPGQPLTVVQVVGADAAALPAGVAVTTSADRSRVSVTVDSSAAAGDLVLQYQVADATGDADRYTWGVLEVSIQDVPDAPAKPTRQAGSFVDGELRLRITPPQQNNAAITGYTVQAPQGGGYSHDCGLQLICSLPGLTIGVPYTFTVVASNAIGDSAPSPASDPYTVDYLPAAPASVSATPATGSAYPSGGAVSVTWTTVPDPNPGTAVTGYVVLVDGAVAATPGPASTGVVLTGQPNDVDLTVSVYARNGAQVSSSADWNRRGTSVHTVGPPTAPSPAPAASSATDGTITLTWGPAGANGGSSVVYSIVRATGATAADCAAGALASGVTSPWTDTSAVEGQQYTYTVCSSNGSYTRATPTGPVVSLAAPGAASGVLAVADHGAGVFDLRVTGLAVASGTAVRYEYLLSTDGTWRPVPDTGWVVDGNAYGVVTEVQVRGCRDATQAYCGPASSLGSDTPVLTRVTAATCAAGSVPVLTAPANAGPVAVAYQVAYAVPVGGVDAWGPYGSADDAAPAGATAMRVKATVEGYTDPGYGEFPCS